MKKIALRILLLFAVFIGSLIIFMSVFNHREALDTRPMESATLPVMYMREDGITANRMYGYRQEIDEKNFRESLTTVSSGRELTAEIQTFDADVKSLAYRVTSIEDGSVLENGRLSLEKTDGNSVTQFKLSTSVPSDCEYMLRFELDIGESSPIYYYTRLVQDRGQTLSYYFDYADAFYKSCIDNNLTNDMLSQLETESSHVNSSLHYVSLKSDKEQITWDDMAPTLVKKAIPTVLEVNETTVSLKLEYIISAKDENDATEYYTVTEYYRMRRDDGDIVLLNYERTAEQFFDGSLSVLDENGINIGVTGSDIEYAANDNKDMAAFVQAGELWLYDRSANKVCRIFSFRDTEHTDERYVNNSYDISISSVSNEGDTRFIVYGYMAAGNHEGHLGIGVYEYDADSNATREIMFVPLSDGYQVLSGGLSTLAYTNGEKCFFYYNNKIYSIDMTDEPEASLLNDNISRLGISSSQSQKLIAWTQGGDENPSEITELNLETGNNTSIKAPDGDSIRALGFVGEDLVYGLAHSSDCYIDEGDNSIFPMYSVSIVTPSGETAKEYSADGIYVTGVNIDGDLITLSRVARDNGKLVETSEDRLLYYASEDSSEVSILLKVSERNGTQVHLKFSTAGESTNLLELSAKYAAKSSTTLEIPQMTYDSDGYCVYAHGGLYGMYDRINSAVAAADENMGVVISPSQRYVWERGNLKSAVILNASDVPQGILTATADEEAVAEAIGEQYEVINFTGCPLDSVKYQISRGYAVVAQTQTGAALILGYDIYNNIWLYNAQSTETYAVAYEDAEAMFKECGNVFISYNKN